MLNLLRSILLSRRRRLSKPWGFWKCFQWSFSRSWQFAAKHRGHILQMSRQQERAYDRALEDVLSKTFGTR